MNGAPSINLPENWPRLNLGMLQPPFQRRNRTGLGRAAVSDANFRAGTLFVGLGPGDEEPHTLHRPGDVLDIEPNQLGAPQGACEANQKQRPVPDPADRYRTLLVAV